MYQQTQRWIKADVFEDLVRDLRMLLCEIAGRNPQPSAAIFDGRILQSSPESGARAGYDGHKRRKGAKVHLAVDTLGQLLAAIVTPANEQERVQVDALAAKVQAATGESVEVALVDPGRTSNETAADATKHSIRLAVGKLPTANTILSCCRGVGWSSAALPEWHAFAPSPATMSAGPRHWPGCISLPLPC